MKWITEDSRPRERSSRLSNRKAKFSAFQNQRMQMAGPLHQLRSIGNDQSGKNRFIAQGYDCGDNLSVGFHIQNSISLTVAIPPRIIRA
jgi:hypothetical protein